MRNRIVPAVIVPAVIVPAVIAAAMLVGGCVAASARIGPDGRRSTPLRAPAQPPPIGLEVAPVHTTALCPVVTARIHCDAVAVADVKGDVIHFPYPTGLRPADLWSAYSLGPYVTTGGVGQTIGIVSAFDNPNLETDLAVYRRTFKLPPCTSASGCFRKVDENGVPETAVPAATGKSGAVGQDVFNVGGEASLDVDMASATCPNCHILVVETLTESGEDLAIAARTAARLGAQAVSTSYGGLDGADQTQTATDQIYNTPGTVQLASSGDGGYGTEYPAASPNVIAVGGTTLKRQKSTARGWTETAWNLAGSGCSLVEAKPAWQHDPFCLRRMVADISAVADPATGVSVYDTYAAKDSIDGWITIGGTSASSPLVAGIIGLAGNGADLGVGAGYLYAHAKAFRDIQGGQNKKGCGDYTCRGDIGYDGPTGLGTPIGIAGL